MEASERPQLPLDEASVRAIDDRLVIERLTVDDAGAARVVREQAAEGRAPAETVAKAIEIGTRVIDNEGTAANVDYVRREVEATLGELNKELSETLSVGNSELAEQLASAFGADRSGSVQQQIREIIGAATEHQRHEITKLLAAEDASNPLLAIQARLGTKISESDERHRQEMGGLREAHAKEARAMQGQVAELKEHVARLIDQHGFESELAEAEAAGTRKGFSFEETVDDELSRIAALRGDCSSHTGTAHAEGGGKKGDTLIELGAAHGPAAGRIVFEAKDRGLSRNEAWAELNAAMESRAAAFAVLVVAGEGRIPARTQQLHEYEGNKMIVALDRDEPDAFVLEVAYRLAAARVTMARDSGLQIDAAAVRDTAEDAVSTLKQAQAIRSNLTGIKTSSDKARAGLDAMVEAIRAKLERIESLIGDADPGSSAS
jgi:hypothetical protein